MFEDFQSQFMSYDKGAPKSESDYAEQHEVESRVKTETQTMSNNVNNIFSPAAEPKAKISTEVIKKIGPITSPMSLM